MSYIHIKAPIWSERFETIFKAVTDSEAPITPAEVARITGINRSTVGVYLRRLESCGYVTRTHHGEYVEAHP